MLFNDEIYLKKLGIKSISLLSESTFNPVICIQYEDQHLEKLMLKKEFNNSDFEKILNKYLIKRLRKKKLNKLNEIN